LGEGDLHAEDVFEPGLMERYVAWEQLKGVRAALWLADGSS
jgi:hypothetical protein